ncbi:MAG TPA: MFS transporter [Spirochaetia bacterium]|nr:MFS transporter [Spirochaetales bacterium]HRW24168.1 MFS transporter [Spirochaetia bacterium]
MHDWKRSFYAIWAAEFIALAGFATTTPIIPLRLMAMGLTEATGLNFWAGLTQAGAALGMMLFAPIWGSLADSYGRRLMLLRAMFGGAALIGLMALATEPWQLAALRTLQGCVTGTTAAGTVLTASIVPEKEAGYRLGLLQMAIYLGSSTGPLLGGVVSDAFGLTANFAATSALLLAAGLIVTRFVREEFEPKPRSGSVLRNAAPDFSPLRGNPLLGSLMGVVFAAQFAAAVVTPMLPLFVVKLTGGLSGAGSVSGLIISAGSVSGAVAAALIGKVSGRLGYGRTLLACMIGATVFTVPQGFVSTPWQLLWLRLAAGVFLGGTMPSVNALIATSCARDRQGSAYGLSSSMSSAGAALGPAVGATLATVAGYPSVFFATSAILGAIGFAVAASTRRRGPAAA